MAQDAVKRHGNVIATINHTPSGGAVAAGQVVLLGNTTSPTCGIAALPIANGVLGTLEIGGGIYEVVNLDNAANNALVYWSDSVNKVTTTSTNNAIFGFVVENGGGGANSNCLCLHFPYV